MKKIKAKRIIYASSGSVYGISKETNVTEKTELKPISLYNKVKMITERVLMSYNKDFEILAELDSSIVFFIAAKKFVKVIPILKKFFLNRKILICKEITKLYEEYIRFDVSKIENFKSNLRGEITLVLSEKKGPKNNNKLSDSDKKKIRKLIKKFSIKDIVQLINKNNNISKKEIYDFCLNVKNEK